MAQRRGFLLSATLHLVILMALASRSAVAPATRPVAPLPAEPRKTVFLPPTEVLRQLLPPPRAPDRPRPTPAPPPRPSPAHKKEKISIGAPSDERAKGPLILRKEDDLAVTPKGRPDAAPAMATPVPPASELAPREGGAPELSGAEGLRLPGLGRGPLVRGDEGSRTRPSHEAPSIAGSLSRLEQRLQAPGARGLLSGTGRGQQMGPLFFDPEGADFTDWINHFKNEVYRNWILPQPALLGFRGHVGLEFTVERDGRLTNLKMLKSSGTPALDRAAANALLGSLLLPLPADFGPRTVTMQVTFFYNEAQ